MSNLDITYLVGGVLGIAGLLVFGFLILAPAVTAYRRPLHKLGATVLSLYVLAALVGTGVLLGALIILEWPKYF